MILALNKILGFTVLEFRKSQKVLELKKLIDPEYSGVPEVAGSLGIKTYTGDTIPELRLQLGTVLELKSQALIDNLIRQMLSHWRRPGGPRTYMDESIQIPVVDITSDQAWRK
jgi:hypothetical protein